MKNQQERTDKEKLALHVYDLYSSEELEDLHDEAFEQVLAEEATRACRELIKEEIRQRHFQRG
jgi:hypothetical protein